MVTRLVFDFYRQKSEPLVESKETPDLTIPQALSRLLKQARYRGITFYPLDQPANYKKFIDDHNFNPMAICYAFTVSGILADKETFYLISSYDTVEQFSQACLEEYTRILKKCQDVPSFGGSILFIQEDNGLVFHTHDLIVITQRQVRQLLQRRKKKAKGCQIV